MKIPKTAQAFSLALLLATTQAQAATHPLPAHDVCASKDPAFVGSCFVVHARLQHGADNVMVWIWPVATKRYLGLVFEDASDDEQDVHCSIPAYLEKLVLREGKTVYADVAVRPLSKSEPGRMQYVCIAAASKIIARD